MAGGNLLRKAVTSLDSQEDCGVISTRRRDSGGREHILRMSRNTLQ